MNKFACFRGSPKSRQPSPPPRPNPQPQPEPEVLEAAPPPEPAPPPPPPPDPRTVKHDAILSAFQRLQGVDADETAAAAKELRSCARVRAPIHE